MEEYPFGTTVDCPAEGIDLEVGLNLRGFACAPSGYSAYDMLVQLEAEHVTSIQGYDPSWGVFETASFTGSGPAGIDFPIVNGHGYLIYMKGEVLGFLPR
jgi:hypothetical protein